MRQSDPVTSVVFIDDTLGQYEWVALFAYLAT